MGPNHVRCIYSRACMLQDLGLYRLWFGSGMGVVWECASGSKFVGLGHRGKAEGCG